MCLEHRNDVLKDRFLLVVCYHVLVRYLQVRAAL